MRAAHRIALALGAGAGLLFALGWPGGAHRADPRAGSGSLVGARESGAGRAPFQRPSPRALDDTQALSGRSGRDVGRRPLAGGRTDGRQDPLARGVAEAPDAREGGRSTAPERASGRLVRMASPVWHADGLARVEGVDLAGPRPLALWRIEPGVGHAAIVARTSSLDDGSFVFADVPLPGRGSWLTVSGPDERPLGARAAAPQALPARPPAVPTLEWVSVEDAVWRLRVRARAPGGHLLLADTAERELARAPVPEARLALQRPVDLTIPVPDGGAVLVAHELADGRRSEWWAAWPGAPVDPAAWPQAPDTPRGESQPVNEEETR